MLFSRKKSKNKVPEAPSNPVKDYDFSSLMNQVRENHAQFKDVQKVFGRLKKQYHHSNKEK